MRRLIALVVAVPVLAAISAPGADGASAPVVDVQANGNFLTDALMPGSLNFTPASVTASVGQVVRWTNTDQLVPHTVTEDHGLFDLAGTYGATPASPAGFAPGASVQRGFSAGTFHYYCRVHPTQMHGVLSVPVTLARLLGTSGGAGATAASKHRKARHKAKRRRKHKPVVVPAPVATPVPIVPQNRIVVTWALSAPDAGEVYDVRFRMAGAADWQTLANGTTATSAGFPGGPVGTVWEVEARLRSATTPANASDWSPLARIAS